MRAGTQTEELDTIFLWLERRPTPGLLTDDPCSLKSSLGRTTDFSLNRHFPP